MTLFGSIGILGVALYLGAYAALQFGFIRGASYLYTLLNLAAAGCVLISLVEAYNLSSLLIQISWIAISVIGVTRMVIQNNRLVFTPEEMDFAACVLPLLPKADARRLLNQGFWITGEPGTVLTEEGKPNEHLIYLASGTAKVVSQGITVAHMPADSFVGEITYQTGTPATGTVVLTEPSFYFCIATERLRRFLGRNPDIHMQLEQSLAGHLRRKLIASTAAVVARDDDMQAA